MDLLLKYLVLPETNQCISVTFSWSNRTFKIQISWWCYSKEGLPSDNCALTRAKRKVKWGAPWSAGAQGWRGGSEGEGGRGSEGAGAARRRERGGSTQARRRQRGGAPRPREGGGAARRRERGGTPPPREGGEVVRRRERWGTPWPREGGGAERRRERGGAPRAARRWRGGAAQRGDGEDGGRIRPIPWSFMQMDTLTRAADRRQVVWYWKRNGYLFSFFRTGLMNACAVKQNDQI